MSRRELAARVLGNSVVNRLGRVSDGGLRILAYHRILDGDPAELPFDEGVVSATTEQFYHQMRFVRENFDVVTFGGLLQCEREGKQWPNRGLIVTFDDGYRDNYANAFPVLRELKLPAVIFLATGHIGEEVLFWWDLIAFCFKETELESVLLSEISTEPVSLAGHAERKEAIQRVLEWTKKAPDEIRRAFLERLPGLLDVTIDDDIAFAMHLSWDEVRTMSKDGVEFGSHTITHPVLSNVGADRLELELRESKETIERELGKEAVAFAYPAGRGGNFTAESIEAVKQAGYRFAVSYDEGVAQPGVSNRYALPRIHVESNQSLNLFRAKLMFSRFMVGGQDDRSSDR